MADASSLRIGRKTPYGCEPRTWLRLRRSALGRLLKDALGSIEAKGLTELIGSGAQMSTEVARHMDALRHLGHDPSAIFETKGENPHLRPVRVVDEQDSLDRHYSNEIIDKLPEIVTRASRLD